MAHGKINPRVFAISHALLTYQYKPGFLPTLVEDARLKQLILAYCRKRIDERSLRFAKYMGMINGPTQEIEYLRQLENAIKSGRLDKTHPLSYLASGLVMDIMLEAVSSPDEDFYFRVERQISRFLLRQTRLGRVMEACGWVFSRRIRTRIYDDSCSDLQQEFAELELRNLPIWTARWVHLQLCFKAVYFWFDTAFRAMPRPLRWACAVFGAGLLGGLMAQLGMSSGLLP
ncbi:MAG: hypothetical protein AAGE65_03635 [Planctomycetota bacterium]